jgi:hypothetical protein
MLDVVAHACNSSTAKSKAGGSNAKGIEGYRATPCLNCPPARKSALQTGAVVHACSPSYLGG